MRQGAVSKTVGKLLVAALLSTATAAAHAEVQAGIVKVVRGDVQVQRQGGAEKPLQPANQAQSQQLPVNVGDRLFAGDRLVTAEGAAVGVTLRDDTLVSLGPKSSFVLEQYNFNESSGEGNVAVRVLKGTLRYVTGLIGKHAPEHQQVMTPTATIGIRGTDFIVDVASE